MILKKNEEALSPIVALIVLIAIVGITALFITMFVFGSAVDFRAPKFLTISVKQSAEDQIVVQYIGGKDAATFIGANVSIEKGSASTAAGWTWTHGETNGLGQLDSTIGSSTAAISTPGTVWSGMDHVIVVGWFSDNQKQIMINTYV